MTHAPETGAINRLAGFWTCVMQIWDWDRRVPETGAE